MAECGQDPALSNLDAHLRFRFVFRARHARRNHDRAVVLREFVIGAIDLGLVGVRQASRRF